MALKILILTSLLFGQLSFASNFTLKKSIHNGESVPFKKHTGPSKWKNYLTMNLPFIPMPNLLNQVVKSEKKNLMDRGEAHITVVTPPEFWNILRPQGITIDEINAIASSLYIQKSQFDIICLGRGQALIKKKLEYTYFIVIQSKGLITIRKKIQDLFILKGGNPSAFKAHTYYPHITLGFTKRDLHESDNVIKNRSSCIGSITEKI